MNAMRMYLYVEDITANTMQVVDVCKLGDGGSGGTVWNSERGLDHEDVYNRKCRGEKSKSERVQESRGYDA